MGKVIPFPSRCVLSSPVREVIALFQALPKGCLDIWDLVDIQFQQFAAKRAMRPTIVLTELGDWAINNPVAFRTLYGTGLSARR
jgi:hypothetical protein